MCSFFVQGSFASEMTAAKVMDVIAKFPDCDENYRPVWKDPLVDWNLYRHPLAGLLWERQFEQVLLKLGWEKVPNWRCLFVH